MVSTWNHVLGKKNYLCQTDDLSESYPKKCQQYFCLGLPHLANVISKGLGPLLQANIPRLGTLFDEIKSSNYLQIAILFGLQTL